MQFLQSPIISLVVEGRVVRLLVTRGRAVLSWAVVPFNPALVRGGIITRPEEMADIIRQALARGEFRGRLVAAFPGVGVVSRVLTLPRGMTADRDTVVNREARRLMNFTPDTMYLFYDRIVGRKGAQQIYVLLVPKEPLDSLMETFEVLGQKPWIVDLKPLALARASERANVIIAYGETSNIDVVIVVDGVPVLMRNVLLGEDADVEQARTRMVEEIVRSIAFYNDTHRGMPLSAGIPVYLAGDLAADGAALVDIVAAAVDRQVALFAPPLSWPEGLPAAPFAINVGLALRGV